MINEITVENQDYNTALNDLVKKIQNELKPTEKLTLDFQSNFLHEVEFSQKGALHKVSWITN